MRNGPFKLFFKAVHRPPTECAAAGSIAVSPRAVDLASSIRTPGRLLTSPVLLGAPGGGAVGFKVDQRPRRFAPQIDLTPPPRDQIPSL
jgi:hypothetical protein